MFFSKKKKLKRDLEGVKDVILNYGWIKNQMGNCDTGFCLVGAIDHYLGTEELTHDVTRFINIEEAIEKAAGRRIVAFNDMVATSKKDVLDVIDKAIVNC